MYIKVWAICYTKQEAKRNSDLSCNSRELYKCSTAIYHVILANFVNVLYKRFTQMHFK